MPRKATPTPDLAQDETFDEQALAEMQNQMATVQALSDERDLVNQLLGQAQMASAMSQFTATVAVSKMAHVKEMKLYRGLSGVKDRDGRVLTGSWDEFCRLLGSSAPKVNEDINNLRSFGEEALDSMSRMGIGYREMRQYRRLPEDEKTALITAAEDGDKDSFLDLAESLIAKHAKEKETLERQLEESQSDYHAQGEVLATKNRDLDAARTDLERAKRRIQRLSQEDAEKELRTEVSQFAFEAEAHIAGQLREAFTVLSQHGEEHGRDHRQFAASLIRQLELQLNRLRDEFQLPEGDERSDAEEFAWLPQAAESESAG